MDHFLFDLKSITIWKADQDPLTNLELKIDRPTASTL